MARIFNTWLLGAVAVALVAVVAAVIVASGMNDGNSDEVESPASVTTGEQRVLFMNLGMG
jgi:hypothetical protein